MSRIKVSVVKAIKFQYDDGFNPNFTCTFKTAKGAAEHFASQYVLKKSKRLKALQDNWKQKSDAFFARQLDKLRQGTLDASDSYLNDIESNKAFDELMEYKTNLYNRMVRRLRKVFEGMLR